MDLHYTRRGDGEPLLLIHGLGASSVIWGPVLDRLTRERDVIVVDLPGFGRSPAPSNGYVPTPEQLARSVIDFCERLGIDCPDVAGNSLGGWVALEMAKLGGAASVCAISPAGLWRTPLGPRRLARRGLGMSLGPLVGLLIAVPSVRRIAISYSLAHPERVSRAEAAELIRGYLGAPLFAAANQQMRASALEHPELIDVPVTIAWGKLDRVVGRPSRTRFPAGARYVEMDGWGHTPTWDDPEAVATVILETSVRSGTRSGPG